MKKHGFTLAEVLITLTIIGVIAALTIPNLMQKYTKHQYVVGLKKAYSELSNAAKMMPLTENCPAGDFDCVGLFEEKNKATNIDGQEFNGNNANKLLYLLSKNIKHQRYCLTSSGSCSWVTDYKKATPVYFEQYTNNGLITDSGVLYRTYIQDGSRLPYWILVDLNGIKEPNTYGRDKFLFIITNTEKEKLAKGTIVPYGSKLSVYAGDYIDFYWKQNNYCSAKNISKSNGDISTRCTGRVLEEDAMNY